LRLLACLAVLLAAGAAQPAFAQSVLTYHNGVARRGDYVMPDLTFANAATIHIDTGFNAPIADNVYAQPLYWRSATITHGEVIVATESDVVYALNPVTGATLWQTNLGAPVPKSDLPCGNIDPEGITGTPAIDPASGTIYLNALVATANGPRHQVFALNPANGAVLPGWPLDVQSALSAQAIAFDSTVQGERSAVLFVGGQLYISYGGRAGDCGKYHGAVLQVDTGTIAVAGFWATRAAGGGIWAQGGAFSDGKQIFATTGNTFQAASWGDGEAIVRLAPGLAHSTDPADYFTPSNWKTLDAKDSDLGGTDAIGLSIPAGGGTAQRLLALGKDGNAYLVNATYLGGVGRQIATLHVSNSAILTADAVYQTPSQTLVAFQNRADPACGDSITMLNVSAAAIQTAWCHSFKGRGTPIITTTDGVNNPIVWVVGANGDELLHGYNALTGAVVFDGGGAANTLSGVRTYATIMASGGRLYVAGQGRIYAFTYP
jgi:hypothetical protein